LKKIALEKELSKKAHDRKAAFDKEQELIRKRREKLELKEEKIQIRKAKV